MELFSEEQIENVSCLLEKNYQTLSTNETYKQQDKKINRLYEEICNNSPEYLKDIFYEYDALMLDNRRYELSMLYHLGLKNGLEIKDLINT